MDTKYLTPTSAALPEELPLLRYERDAQRLHDQALLLFTAWIGRRIAAFWMEEAAQPAREPRQSAMHPDKPKAENLRELGLERFLSPRLL
ncbi:MAG TPA: hypothetical protein PLW86_05785 [Rhodocyclaceae bacterium]|nr:hypothetical protein [Rhodocyclaceae bacterium]